MINMAQNDPKVAHLLKPVIVCSLYTTISPFMCDTFEINLHIWLLDINPKPHIYCTYMLEVYKYLQTRYQVVEQQRKCPFVFIYVRNIEINHEHFT